MEVLASVWGFRGRMPRRSFLGRSLLAAAAGACGVALVLASAAAQASLTVRRLHEACIFPVSLLGRGAEAHPALWTAWFVAALAVSCGLAFAAGTPGPNRHGPP